MTGKNDAERRRVSDFAEEGVSDSDIRLFLAELDGAIPEVQRFPKGSTVARILAEAGVFPSIGQAKANGHDRPVPPGLTILRIGKNKREIAILSRIDD
jgi:hypothetical protein